MTEPTIKLSSVKHLVYIGLGILTFATAGYQFSSFINKAGNDLQVYQAETNGRLEAFGNEFLEIKALLKSNAAGIKSNAAEIGEVRNTQGDIQDAQGDIQDKQRDIEGSVNELQRYRNEDTAGRAR